MQEFLLNSTWPGQFEIRKEMNMWRFLGISTIPLREALKQNPDSNYLYVQSLAGHQTPAK